MEEEEHEQPSAKDKETPAHDPKFKERFACLFNNPKFSDVCFTFPDSSEKVVASRAILATWSDYFATMFKGGFKEQSDSEIVLHDVEPAIFKEIIEFLYVGKIQLDDEAHVWEVLELANMYQIDLLKKMCEEKIMWKINETTAITMFRFADEYSLRAVKARCLNVINRSFAACTKGKNFLSLSKEQLTEILKYLEAPPNDLLALDIQIESVKLEVIRAWIRHHTSNFSQPSFEGKEKAKEKGKKRKGQREKEKEQEKEEEEEEEEEEMETDIQMEVPFWDESLLRREQLWEHFIQLVHLFQLPIEVLNDIEKDNEIMIVKGMRNKLFQAWKHKAKITTGNRGREFKRRRITKERYTFELPPIFQERRDEDDIVHAVAPVLQCKDYFTLSSTNNN